MREQEQRRPCKLFVPRVKESCLCSVCSYSLIDHDVAPPAPQPFATATTSSTSHYHVPIAVNLPITSLVRHQHSVSSDISSKACSDSQISQNLLPQSSSSLQYSSGLSSTVSIATSNNQLLETQLAPSSNSAFSEYRRSPSKNSNSISEFSTTSLKASPYQTNETQISELESSNRFFSQRNHQSGSTFSITPVLESASVSPNRILKPKPIPMPRSSLNRKNLTAHEKEKKVDYDAENINIDDEPHTSTLFRRIRQRQRDRRADTHPDRTKWSPLAASTEVPVPAKSDSVVKPKNFKEILNQFQTAADSSPLPPSFQRHYSVRLPMTVNQNRQSTLDKDHMMEEAELARSHSIIKSKTAGLAEHSEKQPSPVVRLRPLVENFQKMSVSQNNIRDTKSHPIPPKRRTQILQSVGRIDSEFHQLGQNHCISDRFIETKTRNSLNSDVENKPFSLVNEESCRHSIIVDGSTKPLATVTTQRPPLPKKRSTTKRALVVKNIDNKKSVNRSQSLNSNSNSRKLSTPSEYSNHLNNSSIRNLIHVDENSNEDMSNGCRSCTDQVKYLSGCSDSGYPRGSHSQAYTETPLSLGSLLSSSQPLRLPNLLRFKTTEDLYTEMTVQHTNTLAFLADNFTDIARIHGNFNEFGRTCFNEVSVKTLEFKQVPSLIVKKKVAFFNATFIDSRHQRYKVTVMLAPTCQYTPLMSCHVARYGFRPPVLTEIEEPESVIQHLLDQIGLETHQRSSIYRVVVMPPLSVYSFHSLATQKMLQEMNVQHYEHHVCIILLQLLCALKVLQSAGVEQLSNNFKEFLLTYRTSDLERNLENSHYLPGLMLLRETMEEEIATDFSGNPNKTTRVGLRKYASKALCTLLNYKINFGVPLTAERTEYSPTLLKCVNLLQTEKSSSLTEAKDLLEFTLFCGRVIFDDEMEAKLWIDERRAHEVNRVRLLADRAERFFDIQERLYVQFLLSVTPQSLYQTYKQFKIS